MARLKRKSPALDKATLRISGMRSIDEALDFGNGLSLANYEEHFKALQMELLDYNTMLESIDAMGIAITKKEATLRSYSERILMGITLRYGRGSLEYLQVGGKVRKAPSKRSAEVKEMASAETPGMVHSRPARLGHFPGCPLLRLPHSGHGGQVLLRLA